MTELNPGVLVDCLEGNHGAPDIYGRCIYCDEQILNTALGNKPATIPIIEIPTPAVAETDRALEMLRAQKLPPVEAATKCVNYMDGPLVGLSMFGVPHSATIIKDVSVTLNDDPHAGTFFDPYVTITAYYRIDGECAYLLWQY